MQFFHHGFSCRAIKRRAHPKFEHGQMHGIGIDKFFYPEATVHPDKFLSQGGVGTFERFTQVNG